MIEVKISPLVTEEQRQDPRFKKLYQEVMLFVNSPQHFTAKYRDLLCLHEAGHIVYARLLGASNIRFHGPTMYWCSGCAGCNGNEPSVSRSSVSWTYPPDAETISILKADIGGIMFRQLLSDSPNDATTISRDEGNAWKWYQEKVSSNEEDFSRDLEIARQKIREDLQSPLFMQMIWDAAKEFQREIFPQLPKVTAASLRAKRLGWTY